MVNLLKNNISIEDVAEMYSALVDQGGKYKRCDYLYLIAGHIEIGECQVIDEKCRQIMVKWCYKITNYCNFSPETACMAMYLLDLFLSTDEGKFVLHDKRAYQLASVCCLHIAIKMHEIKKLDMSSLMKLCRGFYDEEEFTNMEYNIFFSLRWCLCPPTPYTYLELLLDLLPPSNVHSCRRTARKLARTQIYNSVQDYHFVTVDPSFIALSSLLNALDEMKFSSDALFSFLHNIMVSSGMDCTNPQVVHLRYRLAFSTIIHDKCNNAESKKKTQSNNTTIEKTKDASNKPAIYSRLQSPTCVNLEPNY